ncbi:MAG TPA: DUF6483 family protein [Candidatus Limiplasma sp.]|nr:DUF6483 family protein [Candidatus Limiplasma sp.]
MYHEDWLMSQIRLLAAAIARAVFRRDAIVYEVGDNAAQSQTDDLYRRLSALLKAGQINEAEDLLFDALRPEDPDLLLLAVDFYQKLNALTDRELEQSNFSRAEILEGLTAVQHMYGLAL